MVAIIYTLKKYVTICLESKEKKGLSGNQRLMAFSADVECLKALSSTYFEIVGNAN